ncbi:MAG: hypothetical protein FJ030_07785 [Chloroflexi bacterium]|nr:hypothetical protein [Chloroflexota bacterium]
MEAIRLNMVIKKDGEITMTGLPYKKGERVEMILLAQPKMQAAIPLMARQLRRSGLIGLWKNRADIRDSATFARALREQAQRRRR